MTGTQSDQIDASCRLPLLALFGGAALWLVVGLALSLAAILTFHNPAMFADCPFLTYGRAQAAANDALLYGFCLPAGLGVMLWIFARLSQSELCLPLVPLAAANIWNLGVLIGIVAILIGDSTGFAWLEFPRGASVLILAAFLLIAISAFATFGARKERELYPSHWFLLAALLWFPWIYSTANLFLTTHHPVRGVAQAVIDWWFANNLVFVWLSLVGVGTAFYLLPKLSGRPLHSRFLALFAFWTLILFGSWCGVPQGAPVPAWMPAASAVASALLIVPLIAIGIIAVKTLCRRGDASSPASAPVAPPPPCKGGPLCHVKFGTTVFILSGLMLIASGCPQFSRVVEFTWFGPAQTQLQILGFFTIVICGAIYDLLPRVMGFALPFPKFVRFQHWLFMLGVALWAGSLAIGGVEQGIKLANPQIAFADSSDVMLIFLRAGTTGLLLLLLGSLLFAANIFAMTLKWKLALFKTMKAAITAPLAASPATAGLAASERGEAMKSGCRVFLAAFIALGLSWCGFVLAPAKQLGRQKQAAVLNSTDVYPIQRSGNATIGLQVYRANGCVACHTEQVRQEGVSCEVVLTGFGKNPVAVTNLVSKLKLAGLTKQEADTAADQITAAGGKSETHIIPTGPDISRPGWGVRQSVAADYLYDAPVQLGSLRAGPDLSNVGFRDPDLNWQLVHLYNPRALVKDSAMPPFRYLFELRKKVDGASSPDALQFPPAAAPPAGYEVVPSIEAKQLAAYLLSLKAGAPLYEAPFTPAITKP